MTSPSAMNRAIMSLIGVLSLLLSLCCSVQASVNALPGHASPVTPRDTPSFMIVGDSISQGRNRDYTWRYRLWQWFQSNGVSVNFVGPYTGTQGQAPPVPPSPPLMYGTTAPPNDTVNQAGGYAADVDPAFTDGGDAHFAVWGRQLAQDVGQIAEMVSTYQPDYLLVELGFNDVGWFISDAQGTLESMVDFINNARSANPNIKMAIANIPQRTFIGGRDDLIVKTDEYNAALPGLLNSMFTDESPLYVVEFEQYYDCDPLACPDGSDGLHPNALGEFHIAQAFATTLSEGFLFPGEPFTVPSDVPVRECDTPSNVVAVPSVCGITVTWDAVDGAYGYYVWSGLEGGNLTSWNENDPRYDTTWIVANITFEYQIQAYCSDVVSGMSAPVSATAEPYAAPNPPNMAVYPTADGIDFTWDEVSGYDVYEYTVLYYDTSQDDYVNEWGFLGSSASITGLNAGDRYITAMQTWATIDGELCAGIPETGQGVIIGGGQPSTPTGVTVVTVGIGATVMITWDDDPNAYQWGLYTHAIDNPDAPYDLQPSFYQTPCGTIGWLYPGAWNYEYCVVAYNGNYSSAMSECVVGPTEISPSFTCPVAPTPPENNPNPTVGWDDPAPTPIVPSAGATGVGATGGGGGIVFIDPTIWSEPSPVATCEAPCTFVLPPWTLGSLTTIDIPPATETIEDTWAETTNGIINYVTSTVTTVIIIPAITTSLIPVSNIIWIPPSGSSSTVLPVISSINPPGITITQNIGPGITWTYSPGPYPTTNIGPPPGFPPSITLSIGGPGPLCADLLGCGSICIIDCDGGGGGGGGDDTGCVGPGCTGGNSDCVGAGCNNDECEGDDCECSEDKSVTSCDVVCTVTLEPSSTITGDCSTTTCVTTNCGTDTTSTSTTTVEGGWDIVLTAFATDQIWTGDSTDAWVATVYSEVMSWWAVEDYYATAEFADASATVPLPTPGTTTFGSGATAAVLACQPSWAAELPSANAEDGITQLCDQCVSEGVVFEDGGTTFQAVQNGTATVSAAWIGGSCAALDFTGSSQADSQFKCVGWLQDIIDDCPIGADGSGTMYGGTLTVECIEWEIAAASTG